MNEVAFTISLILLISIILLFQRFNSIIKKLNKRIEHLEKVISQGQGNVQEIELEDNNFTKMDGITQIENYIHEINIVNQKQQKEIDELYILITGKRKNIIKPQSSFQKHYSNQPFDGIFSELYHNHNGNSHDLGIIEITGNRNNGGSFSSLIDFYHEIEDSYCSNDEENSSICFDFKDHLVSVTAYTIKSSKSQNSSFLLSWVLEGSMSLNNEYWTVIDMHENDQCLCQPEKIRTFLIMETQTPNQFKYIRLRILSPNSHNQRILEISHIELFGTYY